MSDDPLKLARTMAIAMDKTFHESNAANSWRAVANAIEAAYAKIAELERDRDDWKSRAHAKRGAKPEQEDDLIEKMARYLCNEDGNDPDEELMEHPFWELYAADASNLLAIAKPLAARPKIGDEG
jgi:hypothetical protein